MLLESLYKIYCTRYDVSIDSRTIKKKALFFALSGQKYDGHLFIEEALEKGAIGVVIDNINYYNSNDKRYWLVDNVLITLQELAHYHRKQFQIPVISITGSNGKTTTKELINTVLSTKYNVLATKGNFNNHIGVPLTLLQITPKTEIAVIEMGAKNLGDISKLCAIAMPTHGLITNISPVHLTGFKTLEEVVRGKSELYYYLIQNNKDVFINSEDKILQNMGKRFTKPYYYGNKGTYYPCICLSALPYVIIKDKNRKLYTKLPGKHHFSNIASALCIGKFFNIPLQQAHASIAQYYPNNNRSQIIKQGSNTIILDAYNANPVSMQAAITMLHQWPANSKVLILGDMLELGSATKKYHQEIGLATIQGQYDEVIFLGKNMKSAHMKNPISTYFIDKNALIFYLKKKKFSNTTFLLKASRSIELETLVNLLG